MNAVEAPAHTYGGRLSPMAVRRLIGVWLLVLLVDVVAVIVMTHLTFDDGLDRVFSGDAARFNEYQSAADTFIQRENDVVVVFEANDLADDGLLEAIRDFALEAQFLDDVVAISSIFALQRWDGDDPGTLIPAELPEASDLRQLLSDLRVTTGGPGHLISEDHKATAVVLSYPSAPFDSAVAAARIKAATDLAAEAVGAQSIKTALTGAPLLRIETINGLFDDLLRLNLIGIAVGFIVCAVALRSAALAALTTMPASTALMWVMGSFPALGQAINMVTVAVPVLILVLSFADGLHLTFETRRLVREGYAVPQAVFQALRRVGPACVLASVTTAAAFLALSFSDSDLVASLGHAGILASLVGLVAVLITHPMLFLSADRLGLLEPIFARSGDVPAIESCNVFWRWGLRRHRVVVVGSIVLLAVAGFGYATVTPQYTLLENVDRQSSPAQTLETLNDSLLPVWSIDVPVPLGGAVISPGDVALMERIAAVLGAVAMGGIVVSPLDLAKAGDADRAMTARRLDRALSGMPESQRGRFLSRDGRTAMMRLHVPDRGASENRRLTLALEAALADDPQIAEAGADRATGLLVMAGFMSERILRQLNICFLIAVGLSGALVALWFRSVSFGLIALVPNVLPIALIGGALSLTGVGLHVASAVSLTIAFGLAVDDTVHVLNRLKLETVPGKRFELAAIETSLRKVTPVLVITTAVLAAGLLGSFMSDVPSVRFFGFLAIAAFCLAIVADVVVLPAWLRACGERFGSGALRLKR